MAKTRVLVVEDEESIRELLKFNLENDGYDVELAGDGELGLRLAQAHPPDLIILDLMLPGIDGYQVCYKLRSDDRLKRVPVVMLTAKSEETDEVIGLGVGADDYVTKPFSPRVLLARLKAVLRRRAESEPASTEDQPVLTRGSITINPNRHEVLVHGQEACLTPIEFKILRFLASNPGRVYTRQRIIDEAQGEDVLITERTVDVHIVSLRRKLGDHAVVIETVRGVGYRFKD